MTNVFLNIANIFPDLTNIVLDKTNINPGSTNILASSSFIGKQFQACGACESLVTLHCGLITPWSDHCNALSGLVFHFN